MVVQEGIVVADPEGTEELCHSLMRLYTRQDITVVNAPFNT